MFPTSLLIQLRSQEGTMSDLYLNKTKLIDHFAIKQQVNLSNLQPLQQYEISLQDGGQQIASKTIVAPPKLYIVEAREKNVSRNYLLHSNGAWSAQGGHDNVLSGNNWFFSFGNIANAPFYKGQTVTFSARYKCVGTGNTGTLMPQFNGTPWGFGEYKLNMADSGQLVHSFVWEKDYTGDAAGLGFRIDGMAATRTVTVDKTKLEIGEYASIWTPAPEDMEDTTGYQVQQVIDFNQTKVKLKASDLENSLWLVALSSKKHVGDVLNKQDFHDALSLSADSLSDSAKFKALNAQNNNVIDLSPTENNIINNLRIKDYQVGNMEVQNG